ncbi:MAG TPA: hypothetical protein VJR27_05240 [Candidatus Saccharimonadales bacterium]|nr:hypothetical protein [Candidatus Saccharimonadales bacterium]
MQQRSKNILAASVATASIAGAFVFGKETGLRLSHDQGLKQGVEQGTQEGYQACLDRITTLRLGDIILTKAALDWLVKDQEKPELIAEQQPGLVNELRMPGLKMVDVTTFTNPDPTKNDENFGLISEAQALQHALGQFAPESDPANSAKFNFQNLYKGGEPGQAAQITVSKFAC